MPPKHPSRTRTRTQSREQRQQPRTWGTRFDYLNTSPPPAHSSSPIPSPSTSPTPGVSSKQLTHTLSLELFGANAKSTEKRDWADDDVPSTLFSPGRTPLVLNLASGPTPGRKTISKQPHDASVFVGSLPPHTDEAEMAQLLAQHLSGFATVQNIKIVRDSRGGLCAFAQCENANQATQLVSQAAPQPFMGRLLRYENARARRTLWISYRTPMTFMECASKDEEGPDIVVDENGVKGRWIESDLPDALRIWKPREVRYPIVTFRADARNIGDASRFDKDASGTDIAPAFRYKGVLFTDLKFDVQTVKTMAEAFGPLESFKPLIENGALEERCTYPAEHDFSRSPDMECSVWEIKWEHRDDCITALNTLRRIPFLSVTWAKDSIPPQTPRSGSLHLRATTSPRYPVAHASHEAISPIARGRPYLLLDARTGNDGDFSNVDSPSTTSTSVRSSNVLPPPKMQLLRRKNDTASQAQEDDTDEGWTVVRPQNMARAIVDSSDNTREDHATIEESETTAHDWTEGDFPPLKSEPASSVEIIRPEHKQEALPTGTFSNVDDAAFSKPEAGEETVPDANECRDTQPFHRPVLAHRRSLSNPVARFQVEAPKTSPNTQKIEIPPTPELANSSLTQTPTTAQADLGSPIYATMMPLAGSGYSKHEQIMPEQEEKQDEEGVALESDQGGIANAGTGRYDHRRQMTIDPKAVFVGGLDHFGRHPWDESRLREIFAKYGEIQKIHIVSPSFKKAGFAFVTFTDEQSAQRAICAEHNRSYDGRQIRVQIRDMFPQRGAFKFRGRGIGRRQFLYDTHRDGMARHGDPTGIAERNSLLLANAGRPFEHHLAYSGRPQNNVPPFQVDPRGPYQLIASGSIGTDSSTLRSLNSFDSKTEVDLSQESDSKTAVSVTPPPSTLNASVSTSGLAVPVAPQTMPPVQAGFYQPQTWVSSYGTQMHYPVACGTMGGMVQPVPVPFAPANQSSDSSAVTAGVPMQWNPMYRPTVSFAPYPYMIVPPATAEASHAATTTSQPTTPVKGQPPVHATGFIQGEHGVLYPVYQPEALTNYMSASSPTQNTMAHRVSTMGSSSTNNSSGQQQPNAIAAHMWHGFSHTPHFIAYPLPPASAAGVTSSATPPASIPQHSIHQQMQNHPSQTPGASIGASMMPSVANLGHSVALPGNPTAFTATGASAHSMPPPYYVGASSNTPAAPLTLHNVIPQGNHGMHAVTPDRLNMYSNKHPPRHEPGHQQGRNGHYGRTHGSNAVGARSPSTARSTGGPGNTTHIDHPHNHHVLQQRQRQASATPHFQLGFNKCTTDGGSSQQHQWTANFRQ